MGDIEVVEEMRVCLFVNTGQRTEADALARVLAVAEAAVAEDGHYRNKDAITAEIGPEAWGYVCDELNENTRTAVAALRGATGEGEGATCDTCGEPIPSDGRALCHECERGEGDYSMEADHA
jgi:RecJ-like exonuclease